VSAGEHVNIPADRAGQRIPPPLTRRAIRPTKDVLARVLADPEGPLAREVIDILTPTAVRPPKSVDSTGGAR
jgi:hypothetical protein